MVLFHDVYEEINCICSGSEAEERLGLPSGLIGEDVTVSITSEITDYGTIYTVEEICEQSEQNFQMEGML